jgi:hypothetical protein
MVGLILYGIMRGITSLRDLEQFARVDLAWISHHPSDTLDFCQDVARICDEHPGVG